MMTDCQEEAVNSDMTHFLIRFTLAINQIGALYLTFTGQLKGVMLEKHLNLRVIEHALLHDLRCTQVRFANDHIHFLTKACQIVRLLACRITSTYYGYRFLAVEEPVASRTGTHASTAVRTLRL